jgi:hypothetical protein
VISAAEFHAAEEGPIKQGDILLAGVTRIVADDRFTPPAWGRLDAFDVTIAGAREGGGDLLLTAGPALVMVTSHDCHLDKEWNRRRTALIKGGMSEKEANAAAENDASLDRAFTASPLIYPDEPGLDRGNLMAGKILGYLPVPASGNGLVPESVVDLTYRVTVDRLDVARVACVSDVVRAQLRYALVSLDTLRARALGFEVEAVVGRQIEDVTIPDANPLLVRLHLEGGDTIELLQQPAEPGAGPARTRGPGR